MSKAQASPLIECPDCGKEHSRLATACPNCARPNVVKNARQQPMLKKELGGGAAVYLVMIPIGGVMYAVFGLNMLGIVGVMLIAVGVVGILIRIMS